MLENKANVPLAKLGSLLQIELVHRLAQENVFAAEFTVQNAHDRQKRGFTRARRPHDGHEFAFFNLEVNPPQHPITACAHGVRLLEIEELDHESHGQRRESRDGR